MDTKTRPTAEQCLQHKWIIEHSKQTIDEVVAKEALINLSLFHKYSTIKVATLQFISSQLISKQEKEDLAHIFKQLDTNGDGRLSREELKEGYLNVYGKLVSYAEVDKIFDSVDSDLSGYIEYSEFVVASINETKLLSTDKL